MTNCVLFLCVAAASTLVMSHEYKIEQEKKK